MSLSTLFTYSQDNKQVAANAKQYLFEKQYYKAAELYLRLLKTEPGNQKYIYNYATSQHYLLNYSAAFNYYKRLTIVSKNTDYTKAYYYEGQSARHLGYYNDAISAFEEYIKYGKSKTLRTSSEQEIEACKFSLAHQFDSSEYVITHIPPPINSSYSEFNPVPISSRELVFSRYQALFEDSIENVFNQSYYSDIYISKQTQQGWKKEKLFDNQFSSAKYFSGNICFNSKKNEAYFTRCLDNDGIIGNCAIYHSKKKKGRWSKPKKLGDKINIDNYSSTHSYLVETTDYNILYFSSNRPNGFGKYDIWYAVIKHGKIERVSNLGSIINTKGNEYTPFYDKEQQLLYFSSDTHKGFGGFDIFKSSGNLNSWAKPDNLGKPLNSPANDYYYFHNRKGKLVYFASNRKGSYFHGGMENCCSDIYKANRIDDETKIEDIPVITDNTNEDSTVVAIKKLLPLSLYFGNDIPDPKTMKTRTKTNYKNLLANYVLEKKEYEKQYSKGLNGDERDEALNNIKNFFENNVEKGFTNLELFANLLKRELKNGKKVRIKIKGYASPLNSAEYNLALSKRRISSLKNYIKEYEEGYFIQYLKEKDKDKASLTIFEDPLGDSQSNGYISDSKDDKRNSIYSPQAALQRKIQIIMYSSSEDNNDSTEYPILSWKQSRLNIGNIKQGKNKSAIIYFTNTGKAELKILSIKTECNYIQTQLEKNTFQTNEKGKIYILVRTKDLELGDNIFSIIIQTNEIESINKYHIKLNIVNP